MVTLMTCVQGRAVLTLKATRFSDCSSCDSPRARSYSRISADPMARALNRLHFGQNESQTRTAMTDDLPLRDWVVAVPESRQLDVLTDMLAVRGATVWRCPLVAIHDSPNEALIQSWLQQFCTTPFDDFIILTGEGIRRLTGFAERIGMRDDWVAALERVRKIARGPKPGNALRELGLKADALADSPTTDGVIETLSTENLSGRNIAVQLYGEEKNEKLQSFLLAQGASISVVAPYIYASDIEATEVSKLIDGLLNNKIDILIFTSVVQVNRLMEVAKKENREELLVNALRSPAPDAPKIAAIGPIVEARLHDLALPIALAPDDKFFMKPLVRKLVEFVEGAPKPR
jgi:uroporphyrinogen-III synthase